MTTLKRRKVGKTKLEVTELGLGGAPMGGFRTNIPDAEAMALTDAAADDGVRYFDTSPFCGYGRSELRMGAALRENRATAACCRPRSADPASCDPAAKRRPTSARTACRLRAGVRLHLRRRHALAGLACGGLAKIDIALIHDVVSDQDRAVLRERFKTAMDGGQGADGLRRAGVIGAIGVGHQQITTPPALHKATVFDCMLLAGRYAPGTGRAHEFLPECLKRNVSVILGGPYSSAS